MSWPHPSPTRTPRPQPPPPPSTALAVVALCTGIGAVVLVPVLGPLAGGPGVAAVVTSAIVLAHRRPGRGMAIAGLVTGIVGLLVTVVVTIALVVLHGTTFLLGTLDGRDPGVQDPAGDGASAGEYAYGQSTVLGDYTVSVDGVTLRGDVVVADLTVTYAGPGAGDAYEDLHGYLYDADGYSYDATDCDEPLSPDAADLPDLAHGRSESFQVCFTGVDDATGAWVEVDDDLTGDHAGWTDEVTLAGASRTDV